MAAKAKKDQSPTPEKPEEKNPAEIEGVDDSTVSSRDKDALFSEAPVTPSARRSRVMGGAEDDVITDPAPAAPVQPESPTATFPAEAYDMTPPSEVGPCDGSLGEDSESASIKDADFLAEETNKKGESA